ncbi:hypothetical protein M0804_015233 [Polistes exclamans]|nr:hypothetical protein M0804_015233 [Polistes exclamans]
MTCDKFHATNCHNKAIGQLLLAAFYGYQSIMFDALEKFEEFFNFRLRLKVHYIHRNAKELLVKPDFRL